VTIATRSVKAITQSPTLFAAADIALFPREGHSDNPDRPDQPWAIRSSVAYHSPAVEIGGRTGHTSRVSLQAVLSRRVGLTAECCLGRQECSPLGNWSLNQTSSKPFYATLDDTRSKLSFLPQNGSMTDGEKFLETLRSAVATHMKENTDISVTHEVEVGSQIYAHLPLGFRLTSYCQERGTIQSCIDIMPYAPLDVLTGEVDFDSWVQNTDTAFKLEYVTTSYNSAGEITSLQEQVQGISRLVGNLRVAVDNAQVTRSSESVPAVLLSLDKTYKEVIHMVFNAEQFKGSWSSSTIPFGRSAHSSLVPL
jgi:hypothetical protein